MRVGYRTRLNRLIENGDENGRLSEIQQDDGDPAHLSTQVNELSKIISDWDRVVREYVG